MIWNLKIKLVFGIYAEEDWSGEIEVESEGTLEYLHLAIQKAVNFENDHMYEFFISRTEISREKQRYDDENEKTFTTKIDEIFPIQKGRKLFYMFDYGDGWIFQISKKRIKPFSPVTSVEYPRLINEVGVKPEQYPDFEDDFA